MIELSIQGLDAFNRVLDPRLFEQRLDRAIERAAEVLRDDTKRMPPVSAQRTGYGAKGIPVAPKHGGTLRQSIQKRKVQLLAAEVYGNVHYSGYVHDGTAKMPARPFFQWLLDDFGGREKVATIVTQHLSSLI